MIWDATECLHLHKKSSVVSGGGGRNQSKSVLHKQKTFSERKRGREKIFFIYVHVWLRGDNFPVINHIEKMQEVYILFFDVYCTSAYKTQIMHQ